MHTFYRSQSISIMFAKNASGAQLSCVVQIGSIAQPHSFLPSSSASFLASLQTREKAASSAKRRCGSKFATPPSLPPSLSWCSAAASSSSSFVPKQLVGGRGRGGDLRLAGSPQRHRRRALLLPSPFFVPFGLGSLPRSFSSSLPSLVRSFAAKTQFVRGFVRSLFGKKERKAVAAAPTAPGKTNFPANANRASAAMIGSQTHTRCVRTPAQPKPTRSSRDPRLGLVQKFVLFASSHGLTWLTVLTC